MAHLRSNGVCGLVGLTSVVFILFHAVLRVAPTLIVEPLLAQLRMTIDNHTAQHKLHDCNQSYALTIGL